MLLANAQAAAAEKSVREEWYSRVSARRDFNAILIVVVENWL